MIIRNRISETFAGGPRQYTQLRNKLLISVEESTKSGRIIQKLESVGLTAEELDSAGVIVAEVTVGIEQAIKKAADRVKNASLPDSMPDMDSEDGDVIDASQEVVDATSNLLLFARNIEGVREAFFAETFVDYGPENLRTPPSERETISASEDEDMTTLKDLNKRLNIEELHKIDKGGNSTVVVFDTGFARGLIDESRIIKKFSGKSVNDVYESSEGHGTMTIGAAVADSDKKGVPYDGPAPKSDVVLVRITNSKGQIDSTVITRAWNWIDNNNIDGPVVMNHSYGTPLCSGRPRTKFCDGPEQELVNRVLRDNSITAVYAAGNEAMRCGHRPSGITNGITGTNSLPSVVTVGALLGNGKEAQRYSSHGRGDCAPVADPKPNVTTPLPEIVYYGTESGWKLKDMSTGLVGSAGGTSHAAPYTAGVIALLQSIAARGGAAADQAEDVTPITIPDGKGSGVPSGRIKKVLQDSAEPPHITATNVAGVLLSEKGYDARFGFGEIRPQKALEKLSE